MQRSLLALCLLFFGFALQAQKIAGPLVIEPGVTDGYILFNPTNYTQAYLIDGCGRVINTWTSQYAAAHTIYLKPDGTLVRTNLLPNAVIDGGGGSGGGVEILDWNSNVLWSYTYNTDLVRQHHDIHVMPNGNILILAWEKKTTAEAIAEGRNPALIPNNQVWPEHIVEVKPIGTNGGEIVWEWHAWDHLIQDHDNTKANYGDVGAHPELIDLNFTTNGLKDWIHANSLDYNPELDQIMISAHSFDELWIIDHSTTTAEAGSHSGGQAGKGGDLLYRWGNPMAYRQGTDADTRLFGQHHTHWIPEGMPNAGKILVFNNRPLGTFSSVDMIDPPVNPDGTYNLTGNLYGPTDLYFTYVADPPTNFWSRNMSGAQVMPNGNLFIGSAAQGVGFEVNTDDEIVWRYKSPVTVNGIVGRTDPTTNPDYVPRPIFRMTKFLRSDPAFVGKVLALGEPIEGEPWAECDLVTGIEEITSDGMAYPNPSHDQLTVTSPGRFTASLTDTFGRRVFEGEGDDQIIIGTASLSSGLYLLRVGKKVEKIIIRH